MERIADVTKDIFVQIIFNNAGFLVTSFFDQAPLGNSMSIWSAMRRPHST
jgi:hypothetical protein